MLSSDHLLRPGLRALKRLSGAGTVSIYLPAPPANAASPLLIHDGDAALPELADLAAARSLTHRVDAELAARTGGRPPLFVRRAASPAGSWIVRLATPGSLLAHLETAGAQTGAGPARRKSDTADTTGIPPPAIWIGLRMAAGAALDWPDGLDGTIADGSSWLWGLGLSAALAWHAQQVGRLDEDPVSLLPGRSRFQASVQQAMARAGRDRRSLALILINPIDFVVVNENFGREAGDSVIREIADRLRASMRSTDLVARYGGAVFSLCLIDAEPEVGRLVAEKLCQKLTEGAYLRGAVRLGFAGGVGTYQPVDAPAGDRRSASSEAPANRGSAADQDRGEPISLFELFRRADRALNLAKQSSEGHVVIWRDQLEATQVGTADRLSGIFTANLAKDYRNMLFLWDTVNIVSRSSDFGSLARRVVERMYNTFKAERVALFSWSKDSGFRLVEGKAQDRASPNAAVPDASLARLLDQARRSAEAHEADGEDGGGRFGFAVPLIGRRRCLGCLYVEGRAGARSFDRSDLVFLKGLAGQLAVTLDRSLLVAQDKVRQERERWLMRSELKELRRALQEAKLVYRSAAMESVVAVLRRLAPTDATLLISGESGTGKELLARTAHELSPRAKKPFVVVDCGAIAAPLIERELFGHERGAYTGAETSRGGRLAEADGGSIILDEIGELPLEVQTRFLRFAQEKQLTPVGGTRARRIDVRLIAVTNRDLEREVAAGRFRADLFYRLNVAPIFIPPLRDRPEDIVYLAQHFLKRYSVQYQKGVRRLSSESEHRLMAYAWPGNVRELQNRILRAVILCEGEELENADLELEAPSSQRPAALQSPARPWVQPPLAEPERHSLPRPAVPQAWDALEAALGRQIEVALASDVPPPLGRWLAEDLVLEANAAARGVLKLGAALLAIPQTTFRRKLRKAARDAATGRSPRAEYWEPARTLIAGLVRASESPATGGQPAADVLKRARHLLLRQVAHARPGNATVGALLMGISEPTFHRWLAELATDPQPS